MCDRLEVGEQLVDDLGEDLLARGEVRVEGAVGNVGLGRDVDDAGVEVAVLLERGAGAGDQLRTGATSSRRRRHVWGRDFGQARHGGEVSGWGVQESVTCRESSARTAPGSCAMVAERHRGA